MTTARSRTGLLPLVALAGAALGSPAFGAPPETIAPRVDIAVLLDTSGSMDGLIDQARRELWSVVNDFLFARREGARPVLRVSLYEYGNDGIAASEGHVRMVRPLTDDLDAVSESLFALKTNGGQEYCGRVIRDACRGLAWTSDPSDVRVIVIAGNEEFTQGDVDFHDAVAEAVKKGIVVHTIYCGQAGDTIDTVWAEGATLGEGVHGTIDQNASHVRIPTPFDDRIAALSTDLNTTYIPYGADGDVAAARQVAQDSNSAVAGSVVARAECKASGNYTNAHWDLVDACAQGTVRLADLKDTDLPEALRAMKPAEREAHVKAMGARRTSIQAEVNELVKQREEFIVAEQAAQPAPPTLAEALRAAIRSQAIRLGFKYEAPAPPQASAK